MKKKLLAFLMGTTLAVGLAACGGGDEAQEEPAEDEVQEEPAEEPTEETEQEDTNQEAAGFDAAAAEEVYQQTCSNCHGGNLEGKVGPTLKQIGGKYSQEEILDILQNGKGGGMPGGLVQGEEAENLAAWLGDKQ
ncbi:cytochrome c551 [Bacillus taeanensis]|uniref:Cytochrome c n=1 Tax=Bacillus taeanensis TaxID=273032 RepID=A0A366XUD7_9BACI|nr:cytochrome c [Bacillus taeanensis]RBW67581.1 cytochrome c [Bacillus taeanensis]